MRGFNVKDAVCVLGDTFIDCIFPIAGINKGTLWRFANESLMVWNSYAALLMGLKCVCHCDIPCWS